VVRYIYLWFNFFSNTLTRDMEFKTNFIGNLIVDSVYYGAHYFFFSIIFSYVDALGQFTSEDVKLFLIITFLSDTISFWFWFLMVFIVSEYDKLKFQKIENYENFTNNTQSQAGWRS